jgi:hypothetical protein
MPERANSFVPRRPASLFVFVFVAISAPVHTPARADSMCIEQPSQQAPEGTRWSARYDRPKARKCWFLVDGNGRDVTALLTQPGGATTQDPLQALSSQLAALFGNSTAAPTSAEPQGAAPQSSPANAPRKPQGITTGANKTDNGVRTDQRNASDGHGAKHTSPGLTEPERNALFEEFMRWQEAQQGMNALKLWPLSN